MLQTIVVWILRAALALVFIGAAVMKLFSQPMMVADFDKIGLGQWSRYFTGSVEIIGSLALLVPRVSIWGAILLLAVDMGAFITQVGVLHLERIHTVVLAAMLIGVIVLSRKPVR